MAAAPNLTSLFMERLYFRIFLASTRKSQVAGTLAGTHKREHCPSFPSLILSRENVNSPGPPRYIIVAMCWTLIRGIILNLGIRQLNWKKMKSGSSYDHRGSILLKPEENEQMFRLIGNRCQVRQYKFCISSLITSTRQSQRLRSILYRSKSFL